MSDRQAPTAFQVIRILARREIALGARRKLMKLLFLGSLLPPVILVVTIVVRIMAEQATGMLLGWDPMMNFIKFQILPVSLLALGLGAPGVARDRAEDVLFLYATRPMLPWHYALGKMLAVALPTAALMFLPGMLIAILRVTVSSDMAWGAAGMMSCKILAVAMAMGWAYSGLCVGASSISRKTRWALLIILAFFIVPDAVAQIIWGGDAFPFSPAELIRVLLDGFMGGWDLRAGWSLAMLLTMGTAGFLLTTWQVKREMIP
jgi:hypothetical protein